MTDGGNSFVHGKEVTGNHVISVSSKRFALMMSTLIPCLPVVNGGLRSGIYLHA